MRLPLLQTLLEGPERRFAHRAARLVEKGKPDQAIETLRAGLVKVPESLSLHSQLIRLLLIQQQLDQAVEEATHLLTSRPESVDAVLELTEVARGRGLATNLLDHALAEHFIRRRKLGEATDHIQRIAAPARAAFLEEKAESFVACGRTGSAGKEAMETGLYAALAQEAEGDDSAALATYRRLLELDSAQFDRLRLRLEGLAQRNPSRTGVRLGIVELSLAHADATSAAAQAMAVLEALPATAARLSSHLSDCLAGDADEDQIRLALGRTRWVEGLFDQALELLEPLCARGRNFAELEPLLSRWRLDRPELHRIGVLLADLLGHQGKGEQALHMISEIVDKLPRPHVEAALLRLLQRYPESPTGTLQLARLRQRNGDADGCMEALEEHLRLAPDRQGEAIPVLTALLRHHPSHREAHLMLAKNFLEDGQVDPAATLLRHLIQQLPAEASTIQKSLEALASSNPGHSGVRLAAAEAWMVSDQPEGAIPHLQGALADPRRAAEIAHRVSMFLEQWPTQGAALVPLIEALEDRLVDPCALLYLQAQLNAALGSLDEAIERLAECYDMAPQRVTEPARKLLRQLIGKDETRSAPRQLLSRILVDAGEPLEAASVVLDGPDPDAGTVSLLLERVEKLWDASPEDAVLGAGLARILLFIGRPLEALEVTEGSLHGRGAGASSAILHLVRGGALGCLDRHDEAVQSLRQAVRLAPELAGKAVDFLESMHELDPANPEVQLNLGRLLGDSGGMERGTQLLVALAARCPDRWRHVLAQVEALAERHESEAAPAQAAATIVGAHGELHSCAVWAARALQRGAVVAEVDQLLSDLVTENPEQPDLLRCLALTRASVRPLDACELLETSADAGSQQAERAIDVLKRVAGLHPELDEPGLVEARIRLSLDDARGAFVALTTALAKEIPSEDTLETLRRVQEKLPRETAPHLAMAQGLLAGKRGPEALSAVEEALGAGAVAEELDPLLAVLIDRHVPGAGLLRARMHMKCGELERAIPDLEAAVQEGLQEPVLDALAEALAEWPEQAAARRLQISLLKRAGDWQRALDCLDEVIHGSLDDEQRVGWLLRRAEVRRQSGDSKGATRDVESAEELAADPDRFLASLQLRRTQRLLEGLPGARGRERVTALLELGRWEEAADAIEHESLTEDLRLMLRARLLVATGNPAGGFQLIREAVPGALLADAAQRCDRPEVALAVIDKMLGQAEVPDLRMARSRLLRQIWQHDLDPGSRVLLGRIPFQPKISHEPVDGERNGLPDPV